MNATSIKPTNKKDKKKQYSFKLFDNFMVRSPLLPLNFFKNQLSSLKLNDLDIDEILQYFKKLIEENKIIKEAIAISSLSLLQSIQQVTPNSKSKDKRNIVKGIFRYLNRVSTRTTPFGLCASVGLGNFSSVSLSQKTGHFRKSVNADMEWVIYLIKSLESDLDIVRQLKIISNQGIIINGSRAKLNYSTDSVDEKSKDNTYISTSINYNEITQQVFEYSKQPINFSDLVNKMHSNYPDTNIEVIENYIYQLVNQEFLITELRPSNESEDILGDILKVLTTLDNPSNITPYLLRIYSKIKSYEKTSIGDGLSTYLDIVEDMNKIIKVKNPLKIDLININVTHLDTSYKENIIEIVELLCKLTAWNGGTNNQELKDYHNRFLQKYGLDREVPILELLDDEMGLGAPNDYQYPPSNDDGTIKQTYGLGNVDKIFLDWITECNIDNKFELVLTDQHIKILENPNEHEVELPASLDIYLSQTRGTDESLNFILSPNPYAIGAGTTFGRFINYFDSNYKNSWAGMAKIEQDIHQDSLVAEVLPMPINKRNLNICQIGKRRDYQINIVNNLYTRNNIDLSEISVGSTHNNLYIKSMSTGKQIIPLASHMLNPSLCPNIYRFLIEIGQSKLGSNYPYFFNNLFNLGLPFMPRITYKNFIISPARWSIKSYSFKKCKNEDDFLREFEIYKEKFNIPNLVHLVYFDNKILLNLENYVHLKDLFREIKNSKNDANISLIECLENVNISNDSIEYCQEFVFSLVNDKKRTSNDIKKGQEHKLLPIISDKERLEYPFEKWIFLKIYCSDNRQDELLGQFLHEFIEENKWYENFFFMRFKDPDFHIRIRFKADSEILIKKGIPSIMNWTKRLRDIGIINRVCFDTYDPELERYGGPSVIGKAEEVFYYDSLITLMLVRKMRFENFSIPKDILSVINIGHYMKLSSFDSTQQLTWLDKRVNYKEWLKEFRKDRNLYLNYFKKFIVETDELSNEDEHYLLNLLTLREDSLTKYFDAIILLEKDNTLYSNTENILDSLIHLHLNRLIGIDRDYETRVLTLFRHTLNNLAFHYSK
ncbi:lantibiotic dehydratase [Metabacillus niabensis]|uniref:lantibiotic dehydratase n=1 Tax=Metabacillus niabensis TaxID=324854 RepID=UPI0039A0B2D3